MVFSVLKHVPFADSAETKGVVAEVAVEMVNKRAAIVVIGFFI